MFSKRARHLSCLFLLSLVASLGLSATASADAPTDYTNRYCLNHNTDTCKWYRDVANTYWGDGVSVTALANQRKLKASILLAFSDNGLFAGVSTTSSSGRGI